MTSALCILGRGIERVATNAGEVWRPTRYIEALSERGGHTGVRVRGLDLDDERAVIAGSNANVLAACQYFREMQRPPRVIIFAAGSPGYLADSGVTEGKIMMEKFVRKARPEHTDILILSHNRDTKDDMDQTLRIAGERGITHVAVITVAVHLPRAAEFAELANSFGRVKFQFIAAEELLAHRHARFARIFGRCEESAAYQRTWAMERRGIEALRSGSYRRSG